MIISRQLAVHKSQRQRTRPDFNTDRFLFLINHKQTRGCVPLMHPDGFCFFSGTHHTQSVESLVNTCKSAVELNYAEEAGVCVCVCVCKRMHLKATSCLSQREDVLYKWSFWWMVCLIWLLENEDEHSLEIAGNLVSTYFLVEYSMVVNSLDTRQILIWANGNRTNNNTHLLPPTPIPTPLFVYYLISCISSSSPQKEESGSVRAPGTTI